LPHLSLTPCSVAAILNPFGKQSPVVLWPEASGIRKEIRLRSRGLCWTIEVFGLEIMVARGAESSAVAVAIRAHRAGWASRLHTYLTGAFASTLEFISYNPPINKGTLYGTK
jgi:hypothetical protein